MSEPLSSPVGPVFVGGTGRSGTTIAGELIGHSSVHELIPVEARFHADPGGLCDLVNGRAGLSEFEKTMTDKWFQRSTKRNQPRGLWVFVDRQELDNALKRLRENFTDDPASAARQLVHDLFDPVAKRAGMPTWVEMTPVSGRVTDTLGRIFPDAKFVHMIRDGRDVASSVVRRGWGPNDLPTAMKWWANGIITISRAQARLEPHRILNLRIEALVGPSRDAAYEQLRNFLGLDDEPRMREFFDEKVKYGKAKIGRWHNENTPEELAQIEPLYEAALARLDAAGITLPQ